MLSWYGGTEADMLREQERLRAGYRGNDRVSNKEIDRAIVKWLGDREMEAIRLFDNLSTDDFNEVCEVILAKVADTILFRSDKERKRDNERSERYRTTARYRERALEYQQDREKDQDDFSSTGGTPTKSSRETLPSFYDLDFIPFVYESQRTRNARILPDVFKTPPGALATLPVGSPSAAARALKAYDLTTSTVVRNVFSGEFSGPGVYERTSQSANPPASSTASATPGDPEASKSGEASAWPATGADASPPEKDPTAPPVRPCADFAAALARARAVMKELNDGHSPTAAPGRQAELDQARRSSRDRSKRRPQDPIGTPRRERSSSRYRRERSKSRRRRETTPPRPRVASQVTRPSTQPFRLARATRSPASSTDSPVSTPARSPGMDSPATPCRPSPSAYGSASNPHNASLHTYEGCQNWILWEAHHGAEPPFVSELVPASSEGPAPRGCLQWYYHCRLLMYLREAGLEIPRALSNIPALPRGLHVNLWLPLDYERATTECRDINLRGRQLCQAIACALHFRTRHSREPPRFGVIPASVKFFSKAMKVVHRLKMVDPTQLNVSPRTIPEYEQERRDAVALAQAGISCVAVAHDYSHMAPPIARVTDYAEEDPDAPDDDDAGDDSPPKDGPDRNKPSPEDTSPKPRRPQPPPPGPSPRQPGSPGKGQGSPRKAPKDQPDLLDEIDLMTATGGTPPGLQVVREEAAKMVEELKACSRIQPTVTMGSPVTLTPGAALATLNPGKPGVPVVEREQFKLPPLKRARRGSPKECTAAPLDLNVRSSEDSVALASGLSFGAIPSFERPALDAALNHLAEMGRQHPEMVQPDPFLAPDLQSLLGSDQGIGMSFDSDDLSSFEPNAVDLDCDPEDLASLL